MTAAPAAVVLAPHVWTDWPLPTPGHAADKEERGRVVVVAGSREMPGAAVLAATAALRAGAGKLVVATGASVATAVGVAVPEARVIGLPETAAGGFEPAGVERLRDVLRRADAVLVGPGMQDPETTCAFVAAALAQDPAGQAPWLLDACAMHAATDGRAGGGRPFVLTPHAGEMAGLCGDSKEAVTADPDGVARRFSARWQAVVALKGAFTVIAAPDGRVWHHRGGNAGLGTSGSGDVLAGVVAGLLARGAEPPQAAAWGVALHARAGETLALRSGPLGYLARELSAEIPRLLQHLAG